VLPERQCLHGVAERSDLTTTRLVIITTAIDHNLLELEVVHVLDVDFRRQCRHTGRMHRDRTLTNCNPHTALPQQTVNYTRANLTLTFYGTSYHVIYQI